MRWPGRLELLRGDALRADVLLDGAHNPAGARALAGPSGSWGCAASRLVFGAMRGKRVPAMLRALAALDPIPVFTAVDDRAPVRHGSCSTPGAGAGRRSRRAWPRRAGTRAGGGLRRSPDQPLVVAGSLYLVGAVRAMLAGEEAAA